MLLYLLRHAEAEPYQADDFSRRLTEKGIAQAARVGEFILRQGLSPDLILSSPVLRAKETAEIVAQKSGAPEILLVPRFSCGMTPDDAFAEMSGYTRLDSLIIVGHEPDLGTLIASLIGIRSAASLRVSKASLTAIDLGRFAPASGVLRFFLPVRLL